MTRLRCRFAGLAPALLLVVLPATPILAQDSDEGIREHRGGFWLSGGLGVGLAEDGGEVGGAGYFRLGGTLGDHFALGADGVGVMQDADLGPGFENETRSYTNTTAALYYFPSLDRGLFLKAGAGIAGQEVTGESGNTTVTVTNEAFAATLGAGWDLQLGDGNLYLTPNFDIMAQDMEDFFFVGTVGIGFR